MWRKHLIGIGFSLFVLWGWASFYPYRPHISRLHISDEKLTESFYKHQANFKKIVRMANEDSAVRFVHRDYVILNGYNIWRDDSQEGFSTQRWNEYKELFNQLGSPYIHRVSKEGDVLQIASASTAVSDIGDYESIVISKGYAYSLKEPFPLVESLDEMGFESRGTYYKRINEHWYLYHEWGISKPE